MAIESSCLPAALFPGLSEADLNGSLYALMSSHYGIDMISGTANVEPTLPDERTAELLGIPPAQPCFRIRTVVRDRRGRAVECGESVYRGDRYTITVELMPSTGSQDHKHRHPHP